MIFSFCEKNCDETLRELFYRGKLYRDFFYVAKTGRCGAGRSAFLPRREGSGQGDKAEQTTPLAAAFAKRLDLGARERHLPLFFLTERVFFDGAEKLPRARNFHAEKFTKFLKIGEIFLAICAFFAFLKKNF